MKSITFFCYFWLFMHLALPIQASVSGTDEDNSYTQTSSRSLKSPIKNDQLEVYGEIYKKASKLRTDAIVQINYYRESESVDPDMALLAIFQHCDYIAHFSNALNPGWMSYERFSQHHSDFEWRAIALNTESSAENVLDLYESMLWLSFYRELFYVRLDDGTYVLKDEHLGMPKSHLKFINSIPSSTQSTQGQEPFFSQEDFAQLLRRHDTDRGLAPFLLARLESPSDHHGFQLAEFYNCDVSDENNALNSYVDACPDKRRLANAFLKTANTIAECEDWVTSQKFLHHRYKILKSWFEDVSQILCQTQDKDDIENFSHELTELLSLLPTTTIERSSAYSVLEDYDSAICILEEEAVVHGKRLEAIRAYLDIEPADLEKLSDKVLADLYNDLFSLYFITSKNLKIKELYYEIKERNKLALLTNDSKYCVLSYFTDAIQDLQNQEHVLWRQSTALTKEAKLLYNTMPKPSCFQTLMRLFHRYVY